MKSTRKMKKGFTQMLFVLAVVAFALPAAAQPNTWERLAPTPRTSAMSGNIGGWLYVAGGADETRDVATLEAYDPEANAWYSLPPMPEGRYSGAAAVVGDLLYVIGGWQTSPPFPTPTVYVYDSLTDRWSTRAPFPEPVGSGCSAAAVIDRKIYVHTPCNGFSGYRSFFHVYDPDMNRWTRLPDVPNASGRSGAVAEVLDGKFYLAGGANDGGYSARVDVYDPVQNMWLPPAASMPTPRASAVAGVIAGKLYVAGGNNAGTLLGPVVEYDPINNRWQSLASIPTPRNALGGAAIGGRLFAVLGGTATHLTRAVEVYTPPAGAVEK